MELSNLNQLLDKPLYEVVKKDIIRLSSRDNVLKAIKKMRIKNDRCALIIHNEEVVGVVTKTDILFKVISQRRDPHNVMVRDIMSSPVIILPASAKIHEALDTMDKYTIRQIFVGSDSSIVGIVTRDALFELVYKVNIKSVEYNAIRLSTTDKELRCPYCDSLFEHKDELSIHIDRIHIGNGVLEGDIRKIFE